MTILADHQIRRLALDHGMIAPFAEPTRYDHMVRRVVSYGVTSYGYDMRVSDKFKVINPAAAAHGGHSDAFLDPLGRNDHLVVDVQTPYIDIGPGAMILAVSLERFEIPRDIHCDVVGKSTYARCGIVVNVTPLEPEWCGYVTIEISNTSELPVRVYANQGIAQVRFWRADEACETSYADKGGKYQGQPDEPVLSR